MFGSVVPAEKQRQMKGSNSYDRSSPLSLPSAKTVERRRGTETLRRDPRGCGKSSTFMAIGCVDGDLNDPWRCYTTINEYSRICEVHQLCRADSRAIHNSNFGVTPGGTVEMWRRMGLTTITPYPIHHRSQLHPIYPSLQISSLNAGRDKCASYIAPSSRQPHQIIAACSEESGPERVLRHLKAGMYTRAAT
jgi:hypothetical protein